MDNRVIADYLTLWEVIIHTINPFPTRPRQIYRSVRTSRCNLGLIRIVIPEQHPIGQVRPHFEPFGVVEVVDDDTMMTERKQFDILIRTNICERRRPGNMMKLAYVLVQVELYVMLTCR